jgi:hypothetical protein
MSQDPLHFGTDLPPWPQADFAAFGEIEITARAADSESGS